MSQETNKLSSDQARALIEKWRDDPVLFCESVLGLRLWEGQARIANAIKEHERVTVRSGHKCGKSTIAAALALWFACTRPNCRVIMTSSVAHQVREILYKEVVKLHRRARFPLGGVVNVMPGLGVRWADGRCIVGLAAGKGENIAGYSGTIFFICDEASGISQEIFDVVEGNMASGSCKLLLTGNPTALEGLHYDSFHGKSKHWKQIHISSLEASAYADKFPGLAKASWLKEREEEWGTDSAWWKIRVLGDFPDADASALIDRRLLLEAEQRWDDKEFHASQKCFPLRIGVDPGREGSDSTAIVLIRGKALCTYPIRKQGLDGEAIANEVRRLIEKHGRGEKPMVMIDSIGLGASPYDFLRRLDCCRVYGIKASERAQRHDEFANTRAELAWGLKNWVESGAAVPHDHLFTGELSSIRYETDLKGKIRIESKDEVRQRLGRSPDVFDAAALAVYNPPRLVAPTRSVGQGIL